MRLSRLVPIILLIIAPLAVSGAQGGQAGQGKAAGQRLAAMFKAADTDGDGKLSLVEFTSAAWKRADVNRDGVISPADRQARANGRKVAPPANGKARAFGGKYDANGDGKLDTAEFATMQADRFKRLDRSGDGFLTPREMAAGAVRAVRRVRAGIAERLKAMDKDGDGKISKGEWTGKPEMFTRLDRDKDGFIEKAELPKGGAREQIRVRLKALDKDGDGRVSKAEWNGRPAMFDKLDTNHDGYIDRSDRPNPKP